MTDFRAIVYSMDVSPNAGSTSARSLTRTFAFRTSVTLEALEALQFPVSEFKNVQVGETMEIHGPGYIRIFEVAGRQGDFLELRRMGTENGPDPVQKGRAEIAPGEVFVHVHVPGLKQDSHIVVTPVRSAEDYFITAGEDGFDIDVQTADIVPIAFNWQVLL